MGADDHSLCTKCAPDMTKTKRMKWDSGAQTGLENRAFSRDMKQFFGMLLKLKF